MKHLVVVLTIGCAQLAIRVNGFFPCLLTMAIALLLVLSIWLVYICCRTRSLYLHPTANNGGGKVFLGRPLLLPTQVSHTRLGPGSYNYTVPHFLVGVPVGMQSHLGGLLSLDEPSRNPTQTQTQTAGLMQYLNPNRRAWLTVHAHHHLDKGDDEIGLEGKMRRFLVSQSLNPDEWPFAYLITMPQFLGYQRNLVCVWYLYSAERELTAMIMEVNNYWGQRKIAFSRLVGEGPVQPSPFKSSSFSSPSIQTSEQSSYSCEFHHSSPKHMAYRGTWEKDMFISPFEKVGGSIALRFSDPLAPDSDTNPLHISITLLSPTGKPRLTGRVFTPDDGAHDPVNPLTITPWSLFRFLPYWTGALVVTEMLIIASAMWVRFVKGMHMFQAPEVKPGNICRDETGIERNLERAFRAYLKHLITTSPIPNLRVKYIPSRSHHLRPEVFSSGSPSSLKTRSSRLEDSPNPFPPTTHITIQVLTPEFYTSFPTYKDPIEAFKHESSPVPVDSDPYSRRLYISHPEILLKVLESPPFPLLNPKSHVGNDNALGMSIKRVKVPNLPRRFLNSIRRRGEIQSSASGFLDDFVTSSCSPLEQEAYLSALSAHSLALRVAFGSHKLLSFYVSLAYILANAAVSWFLSWLFLDQLEVGGVTSPDGLYGVPGLATVMAMVCHWALLRGESWMAGFL